MNWFEIVKSIRCPKCKLGKLRLSQYQKPKTWVGNQRGASRAT